MNKCSTIVFQIKTYKILKASLQQQRGAGGQGGGDKGKQMHTVEVEEEVMVEEGQVEEEVLETIVILSSWRRTKEATIGKQKDTQMANG